MMVQRAIYDTLLFFITLSVLFISPHAFTMVNMLLLLADVTVTPIFV